MFELFFTKIAQKQYQKLPKTTQPRINRALASLSISPLSGKKLTGEFSGQRSLKAWPYRIIYSLNEKESRIEITSIIHRQGAYK